MAKKTKIKTKASIDDIKVYLEDLRNFTQNEIPFNLIVRLAELLGATYCLKDKRASGSLERFTHPHLNKLPQYQGFFGVHTKSKGKNNLIVYRQNYKTYIYPALIILMELKEKS